MSEQIILVLQDIGVDRIEFKKMVKKANLDYEVIWEEKNINQADDVSGIVTVKHKVDKDLLNRYSNIKFVACSFTGFDQVDLNLCRERNIAVFNVPAYSTNSVAELTISLAISLLRQIPEVMPVARSGDWSALTAGIELFGKTIGIVGTGEIGLRVAELFNAFGCKLIAWSKTKRQEFVDLDGKYLDTLEELCQQADVITVHVPLNEQTKNLINKKHFELMKPLAYLVNTARGPIVNQVDLTQALNEKQIAGAAIDVYDQEPLPKDDLLTKASNSLLTPHIAYKTKEALQRKAQITVDGIRAFVDGKRLNRID
ncbi:MAG: NAD(P)-dependent oxidoreductase [Patescibacteria group bacterium]